MPDTLPKYDPLEIIRYVDGPKVFGLQPSALKDKINRGEIVAPIPLAENGRSLGWTRQMVADHHTRMVVLAAERAKLNVNRPKQPQPAALVGIKRKKKLRPPTDRKRTA